VTQIPLFLKVAGLSGIAAVAASTVTKAPAPPPATHVQRPSRASAAANVSWLRTFGSYNVRQGTFNLFPDPNGC
jgi:hypothetical protein